MTERSRGPMKTKIPVIKNVFELYYNTALQYMASEGLK